MLWYVLPGGKPVVSLLLPGDMVVFPAGGGECSPNLKHEAMNGRMTQGEVSCIERLPLLSLSDGKPQSGGQRLDGRFLLSNVLMVNIEFIVHLQFINFPMTEIPTGQLF